MPNQALRIGHPVQLFAAGCFDRSVTLWAMDAKRPIFCVAELFADAITDLSLLGDGNGGIEIVASSLDGTVKCLKVAKRELGDIDVQPLHIRQAAEATAVAQPAPKPQSEAFVETACGKKRRRITPETLAHF